ncbi:MAG: hypothetical protein COB46_07035 [Rhodospirillaceae bacterium]|nr:MAG: hypothetical protein COB46_07035 [Rhodospirillaceae bacterium]
MTNENKTEDKIENKKPAKDDPIATAILDMLAGDALLTFKEMAIQIFEPRRRPKDRADGWRKYMNAVKQQTVHMARQGRVDIMRKGKVADPRDFKGIVRVRLAQEKPAGESKSED